MRFLRALTAPWLRFFPSTCSPCVLFSDLCSVIYMPFALSVLSSCWSDLELVCGALPLALIHGRFMVCFGCCFLTFVRAAAISRVFSCLPARLLAVTYHRAPSRVAGRGLPISSHGPFTYLPNVPPWGAPFGGASLVSLPHGGFLSLRAVSLVAFRFMPLARGLCPLPLSLSPSPPISRAVPASFAVPALSRTLSFMRRLRFRLASQGFCLIAHSSGAPLRLVSGPFRRR